MNRNKITEKGSTSSKDAVKNGSTATIRPKKVARRSQMKGKKDPSKIPENPCDENYDPKNDSSVKNGSTAPIRPKKVARRSTMKVKEDPAEIPENLYDEDYDPKNDSSVKNGSTATIRPKKVARRSQMKGKKDPSKIPENPCDENYDPKNDSSVKNGSTAPIRPKKVARRSTMKVKEDPAEIPENLYDEDYDPKNDSSVKNGSTATIRPKKVARRSQMKGKKDPSKIPENPCDENYDPENDSCSTDPIRPKIVPRRSQRLSNMKEDKIVEEVSTSAKDDSSFKNVSTASNRPKRVARQSQMKVEEDPAEIPENLFDEDYDPLEKLDSSQYSNVNVNIHEKLKYIYIQPKLSQHGINIVEMVKDKSHTFYFFDIPDEKKDTLAKYIEELGGTVTTDLGKANRVLFFTTTKMDSNLFFRFLICALAGRFILHASYIYQSNDQKKFLDVNDFCSVKHFKSKFDIHDKEDDSLLTAIKMSIKFRDDYKKNKLPKFYRHNILFAVSEDQNDDVKLLLEILGAHVQPFIHGSIQNPLFTLCVADENSDISQMTKDIVPQTTPKDLRELVWKTYRNFSKC